MWPSKATEYKEFPKSRQQRQEAVEERESVHHILMAHFGDTYAEYRNVLTLLKLPLSCKNWLVVQQKK